MNDDGDENVRKWFFSIVYEIFLGFTPPNPGCTLPLGISDTNKIPDIAFRSTTQQDENFAAKYGRLNHITSNGDQGGWCSRTNDVNQYLEIDLRNVSKITAVATQGRYENNWWTTKYSISYSLTADGYFTPYLSNKVSRTLKTLSIYDYRYTVLRLL